MKKYFVISLLSLLFTKLSFAHSPFLSCELISEKIHCTGSFSDGSSAFGVRITVLDYSEEVLFDGKLDKESKIVFPKPEEEEYYIKFDAGAGHIFEVDYLDVKAGAKDTKVIKDTNNKKDSKD